MQMPLRGCVPVTRTHRTAPWVPIAALVALVLVGGAVLSAVLSAVQGTPSAVARPASPTNTNTVVIAGPIRPMAAEYPLDYKPAATTAEGKVKEVNQSLTPLDPPASAATGGLQQLATASGSSLPRGALATPVTSAAMTNTSAYSLIQKYFPRAEWDRANRVSQCESSQRNVIGPPNSDGSLDYGIFQLNSRGTLPGLLSSTGNSPSNLARALDAEWNVRAAAMLWQSRGWQPWACAAKLGIVN
jgi:hypothetical protein